MPLSAQLQALFGATSNGAAYCRVLSEGPGAPDLVLLEVNPAFERLTGLAGAAGRRAGELLPGLRDRDPWLLERCAEVARTGEPARFERRLEPRGPTLAFTVFRPEPGHVVALVEAPEGRLADVLDAGADGHWERDLATGEVRYSARMCQLVGLPGEEGFAGRHDWTADAHPDDLPGELAKLRAFTEGREERFETTFRVRQPDGGWRWLRHRGKVTARDGEGRPLRITGTTTDVHELRTALARLEESQARLRAFFETPVAGVTVTEAGGPFLEVNEAFCAMLGCSREEVMARTWRELTHPDDLARDAVEAARLGAGELDRFVVDKRYLRKDGGVVWAHLALSRVRVEPRGRTLLVAVTIDVTRRKRVEAALRQAHRQLERHVTNTPLALVEWDSEYRVTRFSGRAEEMFGWSAAEVLGKRIDEVPWVPEEDWPLVRAVMRDMDAGARPDNVNANRNRRKDGRVIHCEWYNSSLYGEDGRLVSVFSLVQDVTARRLAEERLQAAEELARARAAQLGAALAASRQVAIEHHPATGRRTLGPEWTEVTGRSPGEGLDPERWLALVHPDDRERVRLDGERASSGAAPAQEGEFRVAQPGGGWRWLRISARCDQREPDGAPRRLVGTLMDVTALRELQDRAAGAQRLAATGTLARGLAHEINNPLSSVTSNLVFALEQLAAAEARAPGGAPGAERLQDVQEALRDAAQSARRIRDIVVDLRTFALGELPPGRAAPSLVDAVGDARRVAAKALSPCRTVAADVPPLLDLPIPHHELVQALAHLLVNAGQATGPGPNDVRVAGRRLPDGRLELRVSDTGLGMSEATRRRAFEPFFTTRQVGQGRGLGLSVCEGIVHAAGGEIAIESVEGQGTTVTVTLPARAA